MLASSAAMKAHCWTSALRWLVRGLGGVELVGLVPRARPEAKLAAAVVLAALQDARHHDERARAWLSSPSSLEPWAGLLRVDPARLAAIAARALRGSGSNGVPTHNRHTGAVNKV